MTSGPRADDKLEKPTNMARTRQHRKRAGYPPHLRQRVKAACDRLTRKRVRALLITNPRDIRYLTGFVGDDSWAVLTAKSTAVTVLTDFRFQEQVQDEAPHVRVRVRKAGLSEELATLMKKDRLRRLAIQPAHVTLAQRKAIARKIGSGRLVQIDDGLLGQRAVKDAQEIAAIQRALKIQQEAFRRTVRRIKPGQTEQEIAAFLEYQMRLLGADGPSFPTIVAADANASLPHAVPGSRKVRRGGIVLIDWGARWRGYCSDLTRVVAIGKMPRKIREVYQVVLDAQLAAIDAIKPGVALKEVDAVARRIITKAGYGKHFGHSLGHGLGLDIHEQPTLSAKSKGHLQPGQVVTVEPGVYLPGVGGVRIEDDVLVTQRGRRVLSDLPKDLESTMIL